MAIGDVSRPLWEGEGGVRDFTHLLFVSGGACKQAPDACSTSENQVPTNARRRLLPKSGDEIPIENNVGRWVHLWRCCLVKVHQYINRPEGVFRTDCDI